MGGFADSSVEDLVLHGVAALRESIPPVAASPLLDNPETVAAATAGNILTAKGVSVAIYGVGMTAFKILDDAEIQSVIDRLPAQAQQPAAATME